LRFHSPASSTRGANNIAIDSASRAARIADRHILGVSHKGTACGSNSCANSRNAHSISSMWRTCVVRDRMERPYETGETVIPPQTPRKHLKNKAGIALRL
jgi:hypothetical protein